MKNIGSTLKSIRDTMRQDRGISGDAQRLEQLGWMLFLKIMDDKDIELETMDPEYTSVIPEKFMWRNWATDPEGITGDELLTFVDSNTEKDKGLFATLRDLSSTKNPARAFIVKEVFDGSNNYMKSGYEMRKVINKLNDINFNNKEDKQIFGDIYESILKELQAAGNKGEFYTPPAVTKLMTEMTDPKLGEKILDPAAGTGGFLTMAIEHVRDNYVKTVPDEHLLQTNIEGWEFKPVAYVLGLTNLILHGIDVPTYVYKDSLKTEYNGIGSKDRVDVILANPPFGASIAEGVESNFPANFRCKESADLFVVLMMQLLKPNGRAAIVLPDGSITGDGVKARIREKLLKEFNLHTIIRLPQTTFFPATVNTNLLFFQKGTPTKEIWYYEHKLPEGQKSYSKLKPIQYHEFSPLIDWWNNRKESPVSWKVKIEDLNDFDLDIKNPAPELEVNEDPLELYDSQKESDANLNKLIKQIFTETVRSDSLASKILKENPDVFTSKESVKVLTNLILKEAVSGKLTADWRKENDCNKSAQKILEETKIEKDTLVKEKKIKREKILPEILESETPFNLPEGWVWCRFADVVNFQLGKTPASKQSSFWSDGIYNWLSIKDMGHYEHITKTNKKITQKAVDEVFSTQNIVPPGTLLMSFKLTVGKISINDIPLFHNEAIISIFPYTGINKSFLFYLLPIITELSVSKRVLMGQTFNSTSLAKMIFPLPPEKEQKAIVDKVESLLSTVKSLNDEIENNNKNKESLMQAVLKEAFVS